MIGLGEFHRRRAEDVLILLAGFQRVEELLPGQILAGEVGVEREGLDRVVADDRLGVGVGSEHLLVLDQPFLDLALRGVLIGDFERGCSVETLDHVLAERRHFHDVGRRGAEEIHVPSELLGLAHRSDGLADHGAEHHEVAAVGFHPGDLGAEIRRPALVGRHRAGLDLHGDELRGKPVEHVFAVLVVLVHDARPFRMLEVDHVFERRAGRFHIGRQIVELEPLLRLRRIELEGELRRGEREQLGHAGVEHDVLGGEHGRRAHGPDHGEHLVLLDQFLRRQHRALGIVAAVLDGELELAALDAAGGVDLVDSHLHAVGDRHAPALDWSAQVLMGAQRDLGVGDALVRQLGLRAGGTGGERDRGADQRRPAMVEPHGVSSCSAPTGSGGSGDIDSRTVVARLVGPILAQPEDGGQRTERG